MLTSLLTILFMANVGPGLSPHHSQEQVKKWRSPLGTHVRYRRNHEGIPILDRHPKYSLHAPDGKALIDHSGFEPVCFPVFPPIDEKQIDLALRRCAEHSRFFRLSSQARYYLVENDTAIPVLRLILQGASIMDRLYLDVDARSMQELARFNPFMTAAAEGRGQVWRHNPVAASREGQDDSGLVQVLLRGLDGTGYLRGQYVDVTYSDFDNVDPAWASRYWPTYHQGLAHEENQTFIYDPKDLRFEEVSAYYWIDTAQRTLQALGFHILEQPVRVAVHAFEGSNAGYNSENQGLFFGDGFIDTAEDASIVTHEYGHAILDDLVGDFFFEEAGAMFHEGFADFFSYVIADAAAAEVGPDRYPQFMGEWFANYSHQSPPFLRSLDPPGFRYPFLTGEPHEDGRLWSSAFYEMAQTFGATATLSLVLESMFRVTSAQPTEVIPALLDVDNMLYQGLHRTKILEIMRKRGLWEPEQNALISKLLPNDTLVLSSERRLVHISVPTQGTYRIHVHPQSNYVDEAQVLIAHKRLPSTIDFDKGLWVYQDWAWTLDTYARPRLQPGDDIFFLIDASGTFSLSLELVTPSPPQPLQAHEPAEVNLAPGAFAVFRLDDLASLQFIVLHVQYEGSGYAFLTTERAMTTDDVNSDPALFSFLGGDDAMVFNLEPFQETDTLYLTIESSHLNGTGTLFWEGYSRPFVQAGLHPGEQTVLLGQPWENVWSFNLQQAVSGMIISSTTPFTMLARDASGTGRELTRSTFYAGEYHISSDPTYWTIYGNTSSENLLGAFTQPGSYELKLEGVPGEQARIQIVLGKPPAGVEIAEDEPVQTHLASAELMHYRITMPADAKDIRVIHDPLPSGSRLLIYLHNQSAPNESRWTWSDELGERTKLFRVTPPMVWVPEFNLLEPVFRPGEPYELWFYNEGEAPLTLDFAVTFARQERVDSLTDGKIVDMRDNPNVVNLANSFRQPFLIRPPTGTQRIKFHFEHISGSRNLALVIPTGRLKLEHTLMTDYEVGSRELGLSLDQPFPVYFTGEQEPDAEPPVYRVSLTYLSDSAFQAQLSRAQNTTVGSLVTWGSWSAAIDPGAARVLDLMWRPTRHDLDAWVNLVIGLGLALPFDLGLINDRFQGGRKDYALIANTPYASCPEEYYAVSLGMENSYRYLAGYVPDAEPFHFEFGVRARSHASHLLRLTPSAIGSAQVNRAWRRVINPSAATVALTYGDDASQQTATLAGNSFLDLPAQPGVVLRIAADGPLALCESLQGPGFLTSAMGPAYSEPSFWLPHVSPDASDWTAYLLGAQIGTTVPRLQGPGSATQPLTLGTPAPLENTANGADFRKLESGTPAGESFSEDTLSVTEYWQNCTQLAAELPPAFASRTYFVPHLPDNPAWWSGLTLSNPQSSPVQVSVRAYGPFDPSEVVTFTLAADESRVGLMDRYLPNGYSSLNLSWLRIDASAPILAMAFMGGLHVGDTGGMVLPAQDGTHLLLPGNLAGGPFGLALTNTVNQSGSCVVSARDTNGARIAELTLNFDSHERKLLTQADFPHGQPFIVTVESGNLRLVGMQLDLDEAGGLAATAAQVTR